MKIHRFFLISLILVFGFNIRAQEKTDNIPPDTFNLSMFYDMSLEQLDSIKASGVSSELEKFINSLISISTHRFLATRNNPNIVTLVTREEIVNSGARDLIDVLGLVPGFHFAQDRNGNVGLGIRGNWANEGKVLLLMDGQELNEHFTAHVYFGNHFTVDLIERIEIIRGPGSVNYGGFAEFGVINIVTKTPSDFKGVSFGNSSGVSSGSLIRHNYHLYAGTETKNIKASLSVMGGIGQRSTKDHFAFHDWSDSLGIGDFTTMKKQSSLEHLTSNAMISYKTLQFSNITDLYRTTNVNLIDGERKHKQKLGLIGNYTELKWKININQKINITPKININYQTPWEKGTLYADILKDTTINDSVKGDVVVRIKGGTMLNWDINHRINFQAGGEVYTDLSSNLDTNSIFYIQDSVLSYTTYGLYSQLIYKTPYANLFAGVRFETNTIYDPSLVPRLGVTKKFNKFHYKFLFSMAYRAPSVGNIYRSFNGTYVFNADSSKIISKKHGIDPEKTVVFEIEAGYQFNRKTFLTANFFSIDIKDPIVYIFYQDSIIRKINNNNYEGFYAYMNFDQTGTKGLEIDFRIKDRWGYFNINYSYYTVRYSPRISAYSVTNFERDEDNRIEKNTSSVLAFPNHKININFCYYLKNEISINLTGSIIGKRYGHNIWIKEPNPYDANGNLTLAAKKSVDGKLEQFSPNYMFNIFIHKQNLFTQGLHLGFGIYNILNQDFYFLQPYFGLTSPLPGPSREITFKLSYNIPFQLKK